jgi:hypothetical protein
MESKNGIMALDFGSNASIEREDSRKFRLVGKGAKRENNLPGDQLNAKMLREELRQGPPKKIEIKNVQKPDDAALPENSFEKFRKTHAENVIKGVNTSIGYEYKPGDLVPGKILLT